MNGRPKNFPASRLDSRHLGLSAMGAGGVAMGLSGAGAPGFTILVGAVVGVVIAGMLALASIRPWADAKHGPWVGGVPLIAVGVLFLVLAVAFRR